LTECSRSRHFNITQDEDDKRFDTLMHQAEGAVR